MSAIIERLNEENIFVSRQSLYKLLNKYHATSQLGDLPKRTRTRKITQEMMDVMDEALQQDDELTATRLRALLMERWPNTEVSLSSIKRIRKKIGWVCTRPHYCQLLRDVSYETLYVDKQSGLGLLCTPGIRPAQAKFSNTIRDLLQCRLESKIPGLIELIPKITVYHIGGIIIHVNDSTQRNAKLFMKISIGDSHILETPGKILGFQIRKAIS